LDHEIIRRHRKLCDPRDERLKLRAAGSSRQYIERPPTLLRWFARAANQKISLLLVPSGTEILHLHIRNVRGRLGCQRIHARAKDEGR
jgi:hypothetical protein